MVAGKKSKLSSLGILEKAYLGILLLIFGGIVLHAPISVGLSVLFPDYALLVKSWKEILMFVATVAVGLILYDKRQLQILKEPLMIAIAVYAVLHLVLLPIFWQGLTSSVAGLMIDLRYLLYFVLVYVAVKLYPDYRRKFIVLGIAGALIVFVFAILQVFILPYDVLKYVGYSKDTIIPYLVVDRNYDYVRINSTLRGPNPLGAYSCIGLGLLTSWVVFNGNKMHKQKTLLLTALMAFGGLVALWASYSRSAAVAAIVAIAIVLGVRFSRNVTKKIWIICMIALFSALGFLFTLKDTPFVSQTILHENPGMVDTPSSNDGHINSLIDGQKRVLLQPLGGGVGSTGSASLYGSSPLIVENQYLLIAHEAGWAGLVLFLLIFVGVLCRLWEQRQDYLALGVFASGIGLALIGLLLPVWVDDTVAIIWWGLAGLAIGSWNGESGRWYRVGSRWQVGRKK